jgi:tetratricopeptide (TPR) repeat protein
LILSIITILARMTDYLKIPLYFMIISLIMTGCMSASDEFLRAGREKYDQKDYRGAVDFFSQSIELDSTNSDAYFFLGKAQKELHFLRSANENYSRALSYNPKNSEAFLEMGMINLELK